MSNILQFIALMYIKNILLKPNITRRMYTTVKLKHLTSLYFADNHIEWCRQMKALTVNFHLSFIQITFHLSDIVVSLLH
jgi:hypothetical protein